MARMAKLMITWKRIQVLFFSWLTHCRCLMSQLACSRCSHLEHDLPLSTPSKWVKVCVSRDCDLLVRPSVGCAAGGGWFHVTSKDLCLYVASLHCPELAFLHPGRRFFSWHSTAVEYTCHEVEVISPNVIDIWEADLLGTRVKRPLPLTPSDILWLPSQQKGSTAPRMGVITGHRPN